MKGLQIKAVIIAKGEVQRMGYRDVVEWANIWQYIPNKDVTHTMLKINSFLHLLYSKSRNRPPIAHYVSSPQ